MADELNSSDNSANESKAKLPDMRKKVNLDLLSKVRKRFKIMYEADEENRRIAMEDMKFVNVPGYQWDLNMKQERGKRPCYEFNKVRVTGKRIINAMRANRPGVKVRGTEDSDKDNAELQEGLIRNIWEMSDGDTVVDYAAEYQVNGGMTAWRVNTKYARDDTFDQDIVLEMIENPFTVFVDSSAKDYLKRDAEDWALTTRMSKTAFETKWPGAEVQSFDGDMEFDDEEDWNDEETVRIAEYWWKEPHDKEIWKVLNPETGQTSVVDSETDEGQIIAQTPELILERRLVETFKIFSTIASGGRILEDKALWAGRQFPFVMVFGEYVIVDGRTYWFGLPRFAKDAQRSYNVSRTAITETIAQAPLSKWWATQEQAKGLTDQWSVAHKKNFPFMLYNPDPQAPGPPARMGGADVPVALIQESQIASDEIKAVTGIYDASLGARSNETSGRAIFARQNEGEVATYNFQDNMEKGIQRTYEIIMDLIPEIYDTERELRVLGPDGAESYKRVNHVVRDPATNQVVRVHDLSSGKYDVTITSGPSFKTKRQEAAETWGNMVQAVPDIMTVAGDLIFKAMDLPYSDEIAERMRTLLPPQIQASLNEDQDLPPEVMAAMQQAQQAMQQVEQQAAMVQEEGQKAQQDMASAKTERANVKADMAAVDVAMAQVEKAKAEFKQFVAEQTLQLTQKGAVVERDAEMVAQRLQMAKPLVEKYDYVADHAEELSDVKDVVGRIDGVLSEFMGAVDDAVETIEEKADRKVIRGETRRVDGKLIADVEYDDGTRRTLAAVREGGKLRIVPEVDGEP